MSRRRLFARRFLLVVVSLLIAVGLAELAVRILYSGDELDAGIIRAWRTSGSEGLFVLDSDMGYRPVLGSWSFNEYGTSPNGFSRESPPAARRLLFVGDSVTRRAAIVDALAEANAEHSYEFWNAGVDGFDTAQELAFYELCNHEVQPDHVILTMHNNDFQTTPVAFVDDRDRLCAYLPNRRGEVMNRWLSDNSYLYRLYWKARVANLTLPDRKDSAARVRRSLREFRDRLAKDGVRFSVVLFPILLPADDWGDWQKWRRAESLRILNDLGIRYFDLMDPMMAAIAEGVDVQETTGDQWHPSTEAAARMARHLTRQGLLSSPHPKTLRCDRATISLSNPSLCKLRFDGGRGLAGRWYTLRGARGFAEDAKFGVNSVPLRKDDYSEFLEEDGDKLVLGAVGTLDAEGRAELVIVIPKGTTVVEPGVPYHHVLVVQDPGSDSPAYVSNVVSLMLVK